MPTLPFYAKKHLKKGSFLPVFACFLSIFFLFISPFYVFNPSKYQINLSEFLGFKNSTKVVLTLFNVETFEGGTNSRTRYIQSQAMKFNEKNINCFIVVKTLSPDELALCLSSGNLPDMFSFGVGVGNLIQGFLTKLENNPSIRSDLLQYGKTGNSLLAYPFILSGYALITYENFAPEGSSLSNLVASTTKLPGLSLHTSFNAAETLFKNGVHCQTTDLLESEDSYQAYKNFLNKKTKSLLGTARDVARCKNREENGSISALQYRFLGEYSDLVQYISAVETTNSLKTFFAKEFANFLLSKDAQSDLSRFGLFSTRTQSIYPSGYMKEFESALLSPLSSVWAFTSSEKLKENAQISKQKLFLS